MLAINWRYSVTDSYKEESTLTSYRVPPSISSIYNVKMSDASAKKVSKAKKQVKLAEHPKYSDMIKAAILALKERTVSSRQAIVKYIKENYKVGDNAGVHVRTALKKMLTAKLLVQTKGTGCFGIIQTLRSSQEGSQTKRKSPQ